MQRGEMMAQENKRELTYNLTYKEVVDILQIMNGSTNCRELHLELDDLKLTVIRQENNPPGKPAGHRNEPGNAIFQEAPGSAVIDQNKTVLSGSKDQDLEKSQNTSPADPKANGFSAYAVKSPLVGVFYRASAPGAPPFVEVGSRVKENDIVGIIDVMKLMNTITAGVRGVISKICVENEQLVEYGQALMIIDPARNLE
jgi:acetyl-CoA carboxylase biotin carboxyl carrier protein